MNGVVGGISPRGFDSGQSPTSTSDQISANTTILQTGAGGFARLSTALQVLNQSANVASLSQEIATNTGDIASNTAAIATINGQIATIDGRLAGIDNQIALINSTLTTQAGQISTLQGQVSTLQGQVATNTANIATNTGNITTLQGQVSTLQGQVAALQLFANSFNYLQAEVSTGTTYLNGATIYRRSFVPPSTILSTPYAVGNYAHGVANIGYIVAMQGIASLYQGQSLPMTFINAAQNPFQNALSVWGDTTNIYIAVGSTPFPTYTAIVTMWYTATDR